MNTATNTAARLRPLFSIVRNTLRTGAQAADYVEIEALAAGYTASDFDAVVDFLISEVEIVEGIAMCNEGGCKGSFRVALLALTDADLDAGLAAVAA